MQRFPIATAAIAAAWLAAAASAAQTLPGPRPGQVCRADIQRLCPEVTPGHGAVMQCLRGRMAEVSADCRSALMAARAARRAKRAAEAAQGAPPPKLSARAATCGAQAIAAQFRRPLFSKKNSPCVATSALCPCRPP